MKARPILFSGAMVRALLEGRKTQSRRVVKPPKKWAARYPLLRTDVFDGAAWWWDGVHEHIGASQDCPHGAPGDLLWVRETWCDLRGGGFDKPFAYRADSLGRDGREDADVKRAREDYGYKWRPSIFLPRTASRLTLRITAVRVQHLQDISEEDARAEGLTWVSPTWGIPGVAQTWHSSARVSFFALWDSINGIGAADANPWVWALTVEVLHANVDAVLAREAA